MEIMPCRSHDLECALEGLARTDVPLVGFENNSFIIAGYPDDPGIYYFVPKISKLLGISIFSSVDLFLSALILIGSLSSLFFFWRSFSNPFAKIVASLGTLGLACIAYRYSDVYISAYFAVITIVPMAIYTQMRNRKFGIEYLAIMAISGIIIGYCNFLRIHAGTGAFIFILAHTFMQNRTYPQKLSGILILSLFLLIPMIHVRVLETKRNEFLQEYLPINQYMSQVTHHKWHNIYIGLGYLENPYGLKYEDGVAIQKVNSMTSHYTIPKSEEILKSECLKIWRENPVFVLKTLAAKTAKILFKFMVFCNIGLLAFFYLGKPYDQMWPFLIGGLFYSIPGLLTMPYTAYILGMVSLASLFGIHMICLCLEHRKILKFIGASQM